MKPARMANGAAPDHGVDCPWHRRARDAVGYSLHLRLVLVFMALAVTVAVAFMGGMQKVVALGWKEAARPLLIDYVDRLTAEIGSPPSIERAQAIADRLPVTLRIDGPQVHWDSHPHLARPDWMSDKVQRQDHWSRDDTGYRLLHRTTADGHHIEFGLNALSWDKRPRIAWGTLTILLLLTALAYVYVRHLLRPLDDIRRGARRFGNGDFAEPIPVRHAHRPDELGQLAGTINTMGDDIHQMLEAKRALLLAMSHELRSPLTRARLNAELLPESPDVQAQRTALMRDLGEMSRLITDLLESERLAGRHAALHRESTDLAALAAGVVAELEVRHAGAAAVTLDVPPTLPRCMVDPSRVRLLMRNLLDNSLRHNDPGAAPPRMRVRLQDGTVEIEVRDHGPGVPPEHLPHLAQAFYRPDSARQRTTGGVGLGLYLCRLVAQAHGGTLQVDNADPGLRVTARLPCRADDMPEGDPVRP